MVIKSRKGYYQLLINFKEAFNLDIFEEYYLEECFDRYPYIVGDLSDGKLRLKGFSTDPASKSYYKWIDSYIEKSCVFEAPYYVLKRVSSDEEANKLKDFKTEEISKVEHLVLEKENFDKETLVLESNPRVSPKIVLDLNRINRVPMGRLPLEFKTDSEAEEKIVSVVSSSEGFVSSSNGKNFNSYNKQKKWKNNKRKEM